MKTFDDVVKFHGHSCPGLAFGYRVALAALKEMGMENISEDEEVVAIVENDSCAVDAIQVVTGCTFGKGNLIFRDYGKQVYTFIKRPSGDAVRISVDFSPPEETEEEKEMWKRYSEGGRSEDVLKAVHNRKAKKMKAILNAPDSELLKIKKLVMQLPSEARIYPSIRCEMCGEKVAEPKARVKDGKIVCIPCFEGDK
jgi:formylmethanofuran dehydrogenase subunit E